MCFALAIAQRDTSALILLIRTVEGMVVFLKTLELRSVHISHEISIISEASALGDPRRILRLLFHHALTEVTVCQAAVEM